MRTFFTVLAHFIATCIAIFILISFNVETYYSDLLLCILIFFFLPIFHILFFALYKTEESKKYIMYLSIVLALVGLFLGGITGSFFLMILSIVPTTCAYFLMVRPNSFNIRMKALGLYLLLCVGYIVVHYDVFPGYSDETFFIKVPNTIHNVVIDSASSSSYRLTTSSGTLMDTGRTEESKIRIRVPQWDKVSYYTDIKNNVMYIYLKHTGLNILYSLNNSRRTIDIVAPAEIHVEFLEKKNIYN